MPNVISSCSGLAIKYISFQSASIPAMKLFESFSGALFSASVVIAHIHAHEDQAPLEYARFPFQPPYRGSGGEGNASFFLKLWLFTP